MVPIDSNHVTGSWTNTCNLEIGQYLHLYHTISHLNIAYKHAVIVVGDAPSFHKSVEVNISPEQRDQYSYVYLPHRQI